MSLGFISSAFTCRNMRYAQYPAAARLTQTVSAIEKAFHTVPVPRVSAASPAKL